MSNEVETMVTDEMKAAVEADLEKVNAEVETNPDVRTFKRGRKPSLLYVSDIYDFPKEFDLEGLAPTSYLTQPHGEITGLVESQEFTVVEERLAGLLFDQPARDLERGQQLKVVKALKPSGDLVQIPYEMQINNTAGGDYGDAIGVRRQARKNYFIFFDFDTGMPVYCFSNNCWAAAMVPQLAKRFPEHTNAMGTGYCSIKHFARTSPNEAQKFLTGYGGMFSAGATTTQSRTHS